MGLYELRVTISDPEDQPDEAYEALLEAVSSAGYKIVSDDGLTDLGSE